MTLMGHHKIRTKAKFMCGSMVDIQSATPEIRQEKRTKKKEKGEDEEEEEETNVRICYEGRP